jgi:hypothetical protein
MDLHGGLPEVLDIEWRGHHLSQRLDYLGVPFRCSRCRCTGHLRRDCTGKGADESSEDTCLQKDPPDYVTEVDSYGSEEIHYGTEFVSQPENLPTLSGKLKKLCPTLFSTLTLWERDALDKSRWLLSSTSSTKGTWEGDPVTCAPVSVDVGCPKERTTLLP